MRHARHDSAEPRSSTVARAETVGPHAAVPQATIARLQRYAGNRATGRVLQRVSWSHRLR
jgi:hypothetical protein